MSLNLKKIKKTLDLIKEVAKTGKFLKVKRNGIKIKKLSGKVEFVKIPNRTIKVKKCPIKVIKFEEKCQHSLIVSISRS